MKCDNFIVHVIKHTSSQYNPKTKWSARQMNDKIATLPFTSYSNHESTGASLLRFLCVAEGGDLNFSIHLYE